MKAKRLFGNLIGLMVAVLLGVPAPAMAQYQAGLDAIAANRYAESLPYFVGEGKKYPVLEEMGRAQYYSAKGNPEFNLESAYDYAEKAAKSFRSLNPGDKKKVENIIGRDTPIRIRRKIEKLWYDDARDENSLTALNAFLEKLPRANQDQRDSITLMRNLLLFEEAVVENNPDTYYDLIVRDEQSLRRLNPDLYSKAGIAIFDLFIRREGWENADGYKKIYPLAGFAQDIISKSYREALRQKPEGWYPFITTYEGTIFANTAFESLNAFLLEEGSWSQCRDYLERFPDSGLSDQIWEKLYADYRRQNPKPTGLDTFEQLFPGFPFPERLAKDRENAMAFYYDHVIHTNNVAETGSFLTDYPDYPGIGMVWKRHYILTRAAARSYTELDVFLAPNPGIPDTLKNQIVEERQQWLLKTEEEKYNQIVRSGSPSALLKYTLQQPSPLFLEEAKTALGKLILRTGNPIVIKEYLKNFPDFPQRQLLLVRLYEITNAKETVDGINAFVAEYPDFDPARVKTDLGALTGRIISEKYRPSEWTTFYTYLKDFAPAEDAFLVLQKMMLKDFSEKNWTAVRDTLNVYKYLFAGKSSFFDDFYEQIFAQAEPLLFKKLVWEDGVEYPAYVPVFSADGEQMYFCSKTQGSEDIYFSKLSENGWTIPVAISELNSMSANEAPEGISSNATEMLIFFNGDLLESKKTRDGWQKPIPLQGSINTDSWEGDGSYFAGGFIFSRGENNVPDDIYVALYEENGYTLGTPFSIGEVINANGVQRSPFLHRDGKTLYFVSNGHNGFGGMDVYVTRRLDDTWKKWSTPRNLGLFINTDKDDWDFGVSTDGKTAYRVVTDNGVSYISMRNFPEQFRPDPVYTFETTILDTDGRPDDAEVVIQDIATGKILQIVRPDPVTGKVFIPISEKGNYRAELRKKGAPPVSLAIDFTTSDAGKIVQEAVVLTTTEEMIATGRSLAMNNLFFETGSYTILPESFLELDAIAAYLKEAGLTVEIHGHTDDVGTLENNQLLSEYRAAEVGKYLIDKGCPPEKVKTLGFGETQPVVENTDEFSRQKNRRVEFKLLR